MDDVAQGSLGAGTSQALLLTLRGLPVTCLTNLGAETRTGQVEKRRKSSRNERPAPGLELAQTAGFNLGLEYLLNSYHSIYRNSIHSILHSRAILASESTSGDSNFGVESMADSSQADPSVPGQSKGTPINPSETKGLARLPNEVKSTASNVDELLVRLSK